MKKIVVDHESDLQVIKILQEKGYMFLETVRNDKGQFNTIYNVYEEPQNNNDFTESENPNRHNRIGATKSENPEQINTNEVNTNEQNTNKSNKKQMIKNIIKPTIVINIMKL